MSKGSGTSIRRTGKARKARVPKTTHGIVTTRKDGTVYSQDRLVVNRGTDEEVIVPTAQARKLIDRLGLAGRKFRGPDNVERKIS